tara:strand:- start:850 stop:1128 length:279 start_codon:yes stop_codon:yes gene_type:complete
MGEVIVKYKVMLDSDSMGRIDDVCQEINGVSDEIGAVQLVEKKPLAFGLMFVEVTAIIQDGEEMNNPLGRFEDEIKSFEGVTEIETLEMSRL